MFQTKIDIDLARAALAQRAPEELADFILTLAWASNGIGAYVHAYALLNDPSRAAGVLAGEIARLKAGESDYAYRHRQSFEVSARAERTLQAIRSMILPKDRALARQLLADFINGTDDILGNCYEDDDAGRLFDEARELLYSVDAREDAVRGTGK